MNLTRNRLRRMILKEMDVMGVNVNPKDIELVVTAMAATGALLTTGVSQLVMNVMDVLESKYGEIKKADRNALKSTVKEYIEQHSIEGTPMSPTVGDPISSSVVDTIPDAKDDPGIPFYATPEAFGDHAVMYGDDLNESKKLKTNEGNKKMNLTRNTLRRMILKEMDMMGGGMIDPETLQALIGAAKIIVGAGTLAGIHIAIVLEQLARMHAKIQRENDPESNINEEDFVAAVMSSAEDEISDYVAPGMGADPETIDAGPYGDYTDGDDGDYPYYPEGKKIPGDDYDPGEPPNIDDYDMGRGRGPYGNKEAYDNYSSDLEDYYGGDSESKLQLEARRLRRRRLRRRRSI